MKISRVFYWAGLGAVLASAGVRIVEPSSSELQAVHGLVVGVFGIVLAIWFKLDGR